MLSAVAPNAAPSVTRPPYSMRENRSRPISSVPNQWAELGGWKALAGSIVYGPYDVRSGAAMTASTIRARSDPAMTAPGRRGRRRLRRRSVGPRADRGIAHCDDLVWRRWRGSRAAYRTSTTSDVRMNAALTRTTTLWRML